MPCFKWEIKNCFRFLPNHTPASLIWSILLRTFKPFFFSSALSLWGETKLQTQPRAGPQVPSFKLPSHSLWLLRGPRRDDLFCFASLVPSVVRAVLSVPQHGNVMVARGGWRCFCSRRLVTRPVPSPRFLVRDPRDTRAVVCFHLFIHTSGNGGSTNVLCMRGMPYIWWLFFNWYWESVWKFVKRWQQETLCALNLLVFALYVL